MAEATPNSAGFATIHVFIPYYPTPFDTEVENGSCYKCRMQGDVGKTHIIPSEVAP